MRTYNLTWPPNGSNLNKEHNEQVWNRDKVSCLTAMVEVDMNIQNGIDPQKQEKLDFKTV